MFPLERDMWGLGKLLSSLLTVRGLALAKCLLPLVNILSKGEGEGWGIDPSLLLFGQLPLEVYNLYCPFPNFRQLSFLNLCPT